MSDQNVGHVFTHFNAPITIDSTLFSLAANDLSVGEHMRGFIVLVEHLLKIIH
ncbi:MAG: hypothetical protein WB587_07475 [Nitrososphaeraceae archaeon]